ncbi:MAG: glycosyltransferase family 4 protein [Acidobacteriota bacterium]|nr:glycosyltransferase family 4 protein [Acidobacteriota bacterium]MDH3522930.1 glycosyltransferase family 4 protein [Acidobacteriota bacterium]
MSGGPRVAVDARALVDAPAGVGYYTRAVLERLAARGNVRITALSHRAARDAGPLAAAGVQFEVRSAPFGYWWQQRTLPARLRRGDFDLLWSPLGTLPQEVPVPAVVTIHDLTPLFFPYWHSLRNRFTFRRQLPATLRSAARIVAVSQATAGDLGRRFPTCAGRVTVIANGVDPRFVPAPAAAIQTIRDSFDAPDGYVLFVGTLEPRKNVTGLLDAWELARERLPAAPPLLIAGAAGWGSAGLRRRLRRAPGVRYLGRLPRPRLLEALQGALAFAYPSLYEGFGLPVAEAMACGIAVVTSDRSSLPEVVGDAGIQVNPRNTRDLAAALVKLVADPALRAELGAEARARVERFSWERSTEALERVFAEVLNASRSG